MSRILIAEDDNGIAEFIARGLESAGYSCDVTDNGPVAFGMARSGAYQLMILDLGLPNMDGTDILEQLRSLGTTLPIIVLTARTALEDRLRTLEGGANVPVRRAVGPGTAAPGRKQPGHEWGEQHPDSPQRHGAGFTGP